MVTESKPVVIGSINISLITLLQNNTVITRLLAHNLNQSFINIFLMFLMIKKISYNIQILKDLPTNLLL
jgi:hypothetical protein